MTLREVAYGTPAYDATVALRDAVLRRPLGLVFTPEQLAAEADEIHLAGFADDGAVRACVVLVPKPDGVMKLRQMAVHPDHQRQGLGARLVAFAEQVARARGARRMVLNARDAAIGFYAGLGYAVEGEGFVEVTLPHHTMVKDLGGAAPT